MTRVLLFLAALLTLWSAATPRVRPALPDASIPTPEQALTIYNRECGHGECFRRLPPPPDP